jgi:hypothetical protein
MKSKGSTGAKVRDLISAFATNCAFTTEAIRLASEQMSVLRPLAKAGGASEAFLSAIGRICGRKHPASQFLVRARNKVGFHWDPDVVRASVADFATNEILVWVERGDDDETVMRMGTEVLSHALFPDLAHEADEQKKHRAVSDAMEKVLDASGQIREFFIAAIVGFLKANGVVERTSKKGPA